MKTLRKKSCLLTGYYELLLKNLSPDQPEGDQEPKTKRKKPAGISSMTIITILSFTKLIIMISVALIMKLVIWKPV